MQLSIIVQAIAAVSAVQLSPQAAVDELLAADRAFAQQAAQLPPADAFGRMAHPDIAMAVGGRQHFGRDAVLAALRESPNYRGTGMRWTPIRGGISADGTHGFTFGYAEVVGGDPARASRKYLAYWIRQPEGWRIAAYRGGFRSAGEVSTAMLPPSLPDFVAAPREDPAATAAHQASLAAAERAFSDLAQRIGLRAAFDHHVRADGMGFAGNEPGFRIGHAAVIDTFEAAPNSPLRWWTDRSFVASSGDLGVSIGTLAVNQPQEGQPATLPFFTIWRRDGLDQPWRYLAE